MESKNRPLRERAEGVRLRSRENHGHNMQFSGRTKKVLLEASLDNNDFAFRVDSSTTNLSNWRLSARALQDLRAGPPGSHVSAAPIKRLFLLWDKSASSLNVGGKNLTSRDFGEVFHVFSICSVI